ncbi:MAG: Na+/H+ antiporter NhaC family protein [Bacillota bacterium]
MSFSMVNTIWAIVPPLIAIALALITKEVLSSLLVGIISGALFYTNFNLINMLNTMFSLMGEKIGDNATIILFLCLLGILVVLMTKAGGAKAYGEWAQKKISSRSGAMLATSALGAIIFVDDYFNCLTVGTVMRPVTDAHKISRAKLAYIIDATAAPICIIAPISSWAVSVGSTITETGISNGFAYFLQTIPYNLYAILTIIMVLSLSIMKFDFAKMKKYEENALVHGDIHSNDGSKQTHAMESVEISDKGGVIDLVLPVVSLIILSLAAMMYTGYENCVADGITPTVIEIFGNASVNIAIVMGAFVAICLTMVLYLSRKIISFESFMSSVPEGIKSMVPAISILVLAWTLSGICSLMETGTYIGGVIETSGMTLSILPAIIFLVAGGLAFATGTSWGTFGILIPIVVAIFGGVESELLLITISAVLAGAVFGDHISPISDTTILSSTGAECNHIDHVSTQIPYASVVAACCFISYLVTGFVQSPIVALGLGIVMLAGTLAFIKIKSGKSE